MPINWELDGAGGSVPPCTPSLGDNQLMLTTRVDTTDITREIPTSASNEESISWTTDTGDPGVANWASGDYHGSLNVATLDSDGSFTIQLLRRTSACGAGETLGTSSAFTIAGIASFTVNLDPAAGAAGDLYQFRVLGSNSNAHQTKTLTITIDDPDSNSGGQFIAMQSGEIPLFIGGKDNTSGVIDLFIQGKDNISDNIDLFISGKDSIPRQRLFIGLANDRILASNKDARNICTIIDVNDSILTDPFSLDTDSKNCKLYIAEALPGDSGNILRSNFDGSNLENIVASGIGFSDVTIDEVNQFIYFGHTFGPAVDSIIVKANLDGSNPKNIVNTSGLATKGIAVDPISGVIFWTEIDLAANEFIKKAGLDGKNIETILSTSDGLVVSEDIDVFENSIYFTDSAAGNVFRATSEGNDLTIIVSGIFELKKIKIDPLDRKLYFTGDFGDPKILYRSNLDGTNLEIVESGNINTTFSIAFNVEDTDISLFISGKPSGEIPLFIQGGNGAPPSGEISLFVSGKPSGEMDLFIGGKDNISGIADLYIAGKPSGDMPLFIRGFTPSSGNLSLFISSNFPDGSTDLFTLGCAPKATVATPTDLFTISNDVINIFERGVDAIIDQLGKDIKLIFDPIIIPCPNCLFDPIGGKSTNRFKPGGPVPFSDGARCPYCRGAGKTEQERSEIIKASVGWGAEDYSGFEISIQNARAVISTKTLLSDVIKIQRSKTAIIDVGISNILKVKCRRLKDSVPVGLKNSRYATTFWQRI